MIGGIEADLDDWTFLAQLKFLNPDAVWKTCSATLTGKKVLMTAGHCVEGLTDKPEDLEVNIGEFLKSFIPGDPKKLHDQN